MRVHPVIMDVLRMIWLSVFFVCFVRAQKVRPPDNQEMEARYRKALGVISHAFDWSEEEELPKRPIVMREATYSFGYQNYTWAVGLRGRDQFGRRYYNSSGTSACMASLIKPTLAMTTCACVFSWFQSYIQHPMNATMFRPHPRRTIHDITAPFLFIHHTLHTGPSYFLDEDIRYYGIVNHPIPAPECRASATELEQQFALVVLEVDTRVVIGGYDAIMPARLIQDHYDDVVQAANVTGIWTMRLLSYGTKISLPGRIVIPRDRKQLIGQRLDFTNEQVSFKLIQARGLDRSRRACDESGYNFTQPGKECWTVYPSPQMCHILPGAPILTNHGFSIYGIITNEVLCSGQPDYDNRPTDRGFLQVKRLAGEFDGGYLPEGTGTVVDRLLALFDSRVELRERRRQEALKTQPLFNFTAGHIYYDEDFVPDALAKIQQKQQRKKRRSDGLRTSACPIFTFIGLLFPYFFQVFVE